MADPLNITMTVLTAPPPKQFLADATALAAQRIVLAPGTRRHTEVVIGSHRLEIQGRSVALDDIEAVSYSTRLGQANLVQRRTRRRIALALRDDTLVLELGTRRFGRQDAVREAAAFDALVRVLHERVEPRLRRRRVQHLCAGGALTLGPLTLASTGLSVAGPDGERVWPWRSTPLAELRGDHVALVDGGPKGNVHCRIDADIADAVMLPELLWSASAALI
ncbi:MAG: hypothetical protein ACE367_13610 [Acidimicrobiales bacterium]